MSLDRNPQREQMADASMLRTLAAQAEAIWPQELSLLARYGLAEGVSGGSPPLRIADVGCGSGEITRRLAELFPRAELVGVDILESSIAHAREKSPHGERVRYAQGDAFALDLPRDAFDLVVCRHMTQAVPEPERVLAELHRICKPGGVVHVLSEDYGMLHFPNGPHDLDRFWRDGVIALSAATGIDARIGRATWSKMRALGFVDTTVDYVVVDTVRVPRPTFAEIIRAWRDGYTGALAAGSKLAPDEVTVLFDAAIAAILDPASYAVWHVPIIAGRK